MDRIDSVRIQNFRSINDTGQVDLESEITALIGRNESGKTNFLKALQSFNPDYFYDHEDLCQDNLDELECIEDHKIPIISIRLENSDIDGDSDETIVK